MAIYAIGDLHLSFGVNKPMDIFSGWDNHAERIRDNWCKLVGPEDTVIVPGDISWGINFEEIKPDFDFINSLPGTKIIGKGNHDYWWATMKKMNEFIDENGFDTINLLFNNAYVVGDYAICGTRGWFFDDDSGEMDKIVGRECGRLERSIEEARKTGKEPVVFLHYPPLTRDSECKPIMDVLRKAEIKKCFYAHLHGKAIHYAFNGERDGIRFQLVSCDAINFSPMPILR